MRARSRGAGRESERARVLVREFLDALENGFELGNEDVDNLIAVGFLKKLRDGTKDEFPTLRAWLPPRMSAWMSAWTINSICGRDSIATTRSVDPKTVAISSAIGATGGPCCRRLERRPRASSVRAYGRYRRRRRHWVARGSDTCVGCKLRSAVLGSAVAHERIGRSHRSGRRHNNRIHVYLRASDNDLVRSASWSEVGGVLCFCRSFRRGASGPATFSCSLGGARACFRIRHYLPSPAPRALASWRQFHLCSPGRSCRGLDRVLCEAPAPPLKSSDESPSDGTRQWRRRTLMGTIRTYFARMKVVSLLVRIPVGKRR